MAVLLYAAHNAANAAAAYPAGAMADRFGRRLVLVAGIVLFAAACALFACALFAFGSANLAVLGTLFVTVGASTGLVETAQDAHAAGLPTPPCAAAGSGWSDWWRASVTSSPAWWSACCSP